MALNFSHRPIFPAHLPDDNRVPGVGCSQERDIHDILPDDPFGMDISSTVSAITEWLENLGVPDYGVYRGEEGGLDRGRCSSFSGLNFLWDFQPRLGWNEDDNTMFRVNRLDRFATFGHSVNSGDGGGGIRCGCVSTQDVVFDYDDVCSHENEDVLNNINNTMSRVDSLDEFATTVERSVDSGGGICYGCFSTNVLFDSGDGSIHEKRNVLNKNDHTMYIVDSGGGGFQYGCFSAEVVNFGCHNGCVCEKNNVLNRADDTLECSGNSVGGGFCYGCFSTEDVFFRCGDGRVHKNKNVLCHDSFGDTKFVGNRFGEFVKEDVLGHFVDKDGVRHGFGTMNDVMFGYGTGVDGNKNKETFGGIVDGTDDGSPHMALSFALAHLDIPDLLTVERVCKSLRHTVQNDPLLWMNIHIDHPQNDRITDDDLLQLTSRAQGHLQSLNLVDCKVVTDDGLRRVLENNPRMTKLGVPGCIKITTEGVLSCLKAFQPGAVTRINCIRIAGHSVTLEQFKELELLMGVNKHVQPHRPKPHFFNMDNRYIPLEDERPIDLEPCPKCGNLKLVYDCTSESCQPTADQTIQSCRACYTCIPRCEQCGRCISNLPHVETFCLSFVCTDCSPDIGSSSSWHFVYSAIGG